MGIKTDVIIKMANKLSKKYGTTDPEELASCLGIHVLERPFKSQPGAYKVIMNNRFIFLQEDLHPAMKKIVLLHEIGHDQLHRKEAVQTGALQEFNIFNMRESRMEYEANVFAAQLSIPDEEFVEYLEEGYDLQSIASMMGSDINLLALKLSVLVSQGHHFRTMEHQSDFLRYDKFIPDTKSSLL